MDKKRRSVNVVYQGELAISRLGEEAYEGCMGFFQRLEEDLVPGLEVGVGVGGEARRYSYRELGNFPECFLQDQLGQAVSEDEDVSARWLERAEEVVGPWRVRDATAWFRKFKALKDAHAAFLGFEAWRDLLRWSVRRAERSTLDWDMVFGKQFAWNANATEVHLLMAPGTPSRTFISAFRHSTNRPCTDRSQAHKHAEEDKRAWYKEYTEDYKEGVNFFPVAVAKGDFVVNPQEGKEGGVPRRSADQAVWAQYKRVLQLHQRFCAGEEGPAGVTAEDTGSTVFHRSIQVVKRPQPHPDNAILLGQGDGLQLATHEEGRFLAPFLKAARAYHSVHAIGMPALRDICACMHASIVCYVGSWMRNAREAATYSSHQVSRTSMTSWHLLPGAHGPPSGRPVGTVRSPVVACPHPGVMLPSTRARSRMRNAMPIHTWPRRRHPLSVRC